MTEYYVYKHTSSNGTVYFGKGSNNRIYSNSRNRYWKALYVKYGEPNREYLNTGLSEDLAFLLEEAYINSSKRFDIPTCNLSTGGEASASGYKHTEETKKRIRSKLLGVRKSEETKLRMAEGRARRRALTPEAIRKRRLVISKQLDSDDACNRKQVTQYTKNGEFIASYRSIREASKATGVNHGNISSVCYNKLKSAGGYSWVMSTNK